MLLSLSHPTFGFPGGHEASTVPMAKTQLSRKGKDEGDETFSCGQGETQESSLVTVTLYALVPNPLLSLSLHLLGKGSYLELHTIPKSLCLRETKKLPDAS